MKINGRDFLDQQADRTVVAFQPVVKAFVTSSNDEDRYETVIFGDQLDFDVTFSFQRENSEVLLTEQ